MNYFIWTLRLIVAGILLQTLYFKFTAQPESVYIFSQLGLEPYGRLGSGIAELIAGILLLIPRYTWLGALISIAVITGAIFSHLTKLGIVIQNDGGELFILACIVFVGSSLLLWLHKNDLLDFVKKWQK